MAIIVWVSPVFNEEQFHDQNGNVAAGYWIQSYQAGSFSTHQTTYSSDTGFTTNPNPIQLDSSGRLPAGTAIWLESTLAYNLVLTSDQAGLNVIQYFDNVTGVPIPVTSGGGSIVIWQPIADNPTYVSNTEFLIPNSYVTQFAVGNRVQLQNSDTTFQYATVTVVNFTGGNTYVTVQNDSTTLSPLLTTVWWSGNVVFTEGATVDAGGVTYTTPGLTYTNPATVGGQITAVRDQILVINSEIAALNLVWPTAGGPTAYVFTPSPAATAYSANQSYDIVINTASSGSPTINVSGLGPIPLVQLNSAGGYDPAVLYAGQATRILLYNGTDFVVQNPAPAAIAGALYHHGNPGYLKMPDGTIMSYGNVYVPGNVTVTFAAPYTSAPGVSVVPLSAEIGFIFVTSVTATSFVINFRDTSSNPTSATAYWTAIGY